MQAYRAGSRARMANPFPETHLFEQNFRRSEWAGPYGVQKPAELVKLN